MADVLGTTVVNALCNQGDLTIGTPTNIGTAMPLIFNHIRNNRPGHLINMTEQSTGAQLAVVKDSGLS